MASLASSLGWKFISPSGIQRRAPLTTLPTPGISTSHQQHQRDHEDQGACFSQKAIRHLQRQQPATKPMPIDMACRVRKCVGA
jgi:hypothetical protein